MGLSSGVVFGWWNLFFLMVKVIAAEADPSLSTFSVKDLLPLFVIVTEGLLVRDRGRKGFQG